MGLNRIERKKLLKERIKEAEDLAAKLIQNWQPIDDSWEIIEGCAYVRLSTEDQALINNGSMIQQVNMAFDEAKKYSTEERGNLKITKVYIEPGLSGKNVNRPKFQAMTRALKNQDFKFVVAKEVSRLSRDLKHWGDFVEVCKTNYVIVYINGPTDFRNPQDAMFYNQLANMAEYESNLTAQRIKTNNYAAFKSTGKLNQTKSILGFDPVFQSNTKIVGTFSVNIEEVKIVKWIFETFLKYKSLSKTLNEIEQKGIKNKNDRSFTKHSIRHFIENNMYVGIVERNKKNRGLDQSNLKDHEKYMQFKLDIEPLVSPEIFNKAQSILGENRNKKNRNAPTNRTYILSNVLRHEDGSNFCGSSAKGGQNLYYYNKRNKLRLPATLVEDEARKVLLNVLKSENDLKREVKKQMSHIQSTSEIAEKQIKDLKAEIKMIEEKIEDSKDRLSYLIKKGDEYADAFFDEYNQDQKKYKAEITRTQNKIEELQRDIEQPKKELFDVKSCLENIQILQKLLKKSDPVAIKAIYRTLFKSVVVVPNEKEGVIDLQFYLNDGQPTHPSDGGESCVMVKMVGPTGFEPMTSTL